MQHDHVRAFALLPGFPRPQVDGPHFEALVASVEARGQTRPVLIDADGVAWDGRTLANVCWYLGLAPQVQVVNDGYGAAVASLAQRDLTVVEVADLVLAIWSNPDIGLGHGRRSKEVSLWFRNVLGRTRGFSPSQIDQYLRVARATLAQRKAMSGAATLNAAIVILNAVAAPEQVDSREPTAAELGAIDALASAVEVVLAVPEWTSAGRQLMRGLVKSCGRVGLR